MDCIRYFLVIFELLTVLRATCVDSYSAKLCSNECANNLAKCCLKFNLDDLQQIENDPPDAPTQNMLGSSYYPVYQRYSPHPRSWYPTFQSYGNPTSMIPFRQLPVRHVRERRLRARSVAEKLKGLAKLKHRKIGPPQTFNPKKLIEALEKVTKQPLQPSKFNPDTMKFATLNHRKFKPDNIHKPPINNGNWPNGKGPNGKEPNGNWPNGKGPNGKGPKKPLPILRPKETPFPPPENGQDPVLRPPPNGGDGPSPGDDDVFPIRPAPGQGNGIPRFFLHFSLNEGGLVSNKMRKSPS